MNYFAIRTFNYAHQAHLVKSKLDSEGIVCFLFDENINYIHPLLAGATGGIKLKINSRDFGRAEEILNIVSTTRITDYNGNIIVCPKCSSNQIENGFTSLNGILGILSGILTILFGVYPIYLVRMYRCESCGNLFQ